MVFNKGDIVWVDPANRDPQKLKHPAVVWEYTLDRRLRNLEKIELQLSKDYIKTPTKLLAIDKRQLMSSLGTNSSAAL